MAVQKLKLYNPSLPQIWANDIAYGQQPFITCLKYGRQTGKSFWGLMDMISRGMNKGRQKIRFVVPVYSLATKHMQTIDMFFADHEDIKNKIFKKIKYKEQEYHFHNGTIASFLSAESEDGLRGDTCHYMYIDEAAFIKEKTYTEILLPMLTRTKGKLAMFSTPNGKNWFFDLYMKGVEGVDPKLIQCKEATYLDLKDEDDYEDILMVIKALKASMTTTSFQREVMGEFVSDTSLFTGVKEAVRSQKWYDDYHDSNNIIVNGTKPLVPKKYIGIDIGVVHDFTVLTCVDSNNVVIDIDRFNLADEKMTHKEFKDRIIKFYKKHDKDLVAAYMEVNNKELLYDELVGDHGLYKLFDLRTTPQNKPKMVENTVKLFDSYLVRLPEDKQLEKELYAFSSIQNKVTGKWQYKGIDTIHDDMVMSLIIAFYCKYEEENAGYTETY